MARGHDHDVDRLCIKGLTIRNPWAWAIIHGEPMKDVENRDWSTSYRGWVAIHAGAKRVTNDTYRNFSEKFKQVGAMMRLPARDEFEAKAIIGVARITHCTRYYKRQNLSLWFVGDYGFFLADRIPLESPIPCVGHLKLWVLTKDVRQQLIGQVGRAMLDIESQL